MPRDIRKRSSLSGLFGGRTLAIVIAVALSAGCFILGYMVGQTTTEKQAVTEIISVPEQGKVVVEVQPATPSEITAGVAGEAGAQEQTPTAVLQPTEDSAATAEETHKIAAEATAKPAKQTTQEQKKPEEKKEQPKTASAAAKKSSGLNYSVQVGALSSLADADALKRKLEASGYTGITIFRDKDMSGKTVFKVKVGSFETRATADQMLAKLKNRDKIQGFITTTK